MHLQVFRVGDGGLEGLGDDARAFARHHGQHRLRVGRRHPLNLPDDLAHFLRRHPDIVRDGLNFHNLLRFGFGRVRSVFLERARE